MLAKIISGGQVGADQAAWRAAGAFGIPTGGWMPRAFLTAEGPHPEFASRYGAAEMPADGDSGYIDHNVRDSDATLWLGETTTPVASATVSACHRLGNPCLPVYPAASFEPSHVADWITENHIETLHVTGSTEPEQPGIGEQVERFLGQVLERLGHKRTSCR